VSSWPLFPIKVLTTKVGSGATPRGGEASYKELGTPLIRSLNVHFDRFRREGLAFLDDGQAEELKNVEVRQGDVLLNITGASIGRVTQAPPDLDGARVSQHVCIIRPIEDLLPAFLRWYLASPSQQSLINREQTGATRQGLTKEKILNFIVPVPSLTEQRRIVAKIEELFSDLDAGVAALERAKANLKRYRAAVLKAAVEGKLTEAWRAENPTTEPASKLLARILTERRQKWEAAQLAKFAAAKKEPPKNWREKYVEPTPPDATGLPELPNGWCWTSVHQLLTEPTCNGISIKGTDSPPGVPALRLNAMTSSGFDYEQRRYIPISNELATDLAIRAGDLFVSRGNGSLHLVGRGVLAQEPQELVVFPDTMIRVTLFDSVELRRFVNHVWSSRLIRRQIETKARTTAGIYKISQRDVEGFVLPIPPAEEQKRLVDEIEEKLTLVSTAEKLIDANLLRAARLRQSILKQAFAGKLVPQDLRDEPASVLLERLRANRLADERNGTSEVVARTRRPVKSIEFERKADQ